jgi:hypothetical protein
MAARKSPPTSERIAAWVFGHRMLPVLEMLALVRGYDARHDVEIDHAQAERESLAALSLMHEYEFEIEDVWPPLSQSLSIATSKFLSTPESESLPSPLPPGYW